MKSEISVSSYSLKIAGAAILCDINFTIEKAEWVSLVGPSGSGKSMMVKAILQLFHQIGEVEQLGKLTYSTGQQSFDLLAAQSINEIRNQHIGLVFQYSEEVLNQSQKIGHQLLEKIDNPSSIKKSKEHVLKILKEVELSPPLKYYEAYPHQLSGGQVQRVLIALSLINEPSFLLADEPLSALDRNTQVNLLKLLQSLKEERGLGILFITHDMDLAKKYADRFLIINQGVIESKSSIEQLVDIKPIYQKPDFKKNAVLLELRSVTKSYKTSEIFRNNKSSSKVLEDFNLKIYQGEILGICGASGSGKSTIAKLLTSLVQQELGQIFYKGKELSQFDDQAFQKYRTAIQLVFQDSLSALSPHRTIRQLFDELFEIKPTASFKKLQEMMPQLDLQENLLERFPSQLSGGQRQRILILRAMLLETEILICDEIFSSLDRDIAQRILNLLLSLNQEHDTTLVLISHDEELLSQVCNRIIQLDY